MAAQLADQVVAMVAVAADTTVAAEVLEVAVVTPVVLEATAMAAQVEVAALSPSTP